MFFNIGFIFFFFFASAMWFAFIFFIQFIMVTCKDVSI